MKISERVCRDCGSPSRGNPCWWSIRYPSAKPTGADPPCIGYEQDRRYYTRRSRSRTRRIMWAMVALGIVLAWLLIR